MKGKQKVKVAYVINDLLFGGAQKAVLALSTQLDRSAYEPTVYYLNQYPSERGSLHADFEKAGVSLRYIGDGGKTSIRKAIPALRSHFAHDKPDIVHTHLVDATLAGIVAASRSRIPVIIHEHQTHRMYSWKIRLFYRLVRTRAALTICYSPVVEQELFGSTHILSTPPESLPRTSCTIYNGVDSSDEEQFDAAVIRSSIGVPEGSVLVTSVARLVPWKGQRVLLDAFSKIADAVPSLHLAFVGEGTSRAELEECAAVRGLSDRVHLPGTRSDIPAVLAASDISSLSFVYESGDGEAIGIAGYEAMSAGLPVIVSDYASARQTLRDGENAILVPPGDTEALSSALRKLAEDPEQRKRIGRAAAAHIRSSMDWRSIVPIYERIYSLTSS